LNAQPLGIFKQSSELRQPEGSAYPKLFLESNVMPD